MGRPKGSKNKIKQELKLPLPAVPVRIHQTIIDIINRLLTGNKES